MNWKTLPSLSALRAFTAVAEHRSFSAAARALNVTPAAVMQQVRALEKHLGQDLVTRAGRGVTLTGDGQTLARDLTSAFSLISHSITRLTEANRFRPVQVTTSPAFAAKWLMPRLGAFHQKHPDINLLLNPTGQIVAIDSNDIDLAIRYGFQADLPEKAHILLEVDLVVVAAPKLVEGQPVTHPADLLHFPWLQELGTNEVGDWFQRRNVLIDRPPMIMQMPGNLIMDAVTRGDGITYTVRQWVERELKSGDLVELFADEGCGAFHIVTRAGSVREPVQRLIDWLMGQSRQRDTG